MPPPQGTFKVVRSEAVRQQLREWGESAKQAGVFEEYVGALQVVEDRLANQPLEWGDPLSRLPQLGLMIRRGLHWVFAVEYGVHEQERVVFVKHYRLLPNNPLEPPSA